MTIQIAFAMRFVARLFGGLIGAIRNGNSRIIGHRISVKSYLFWGNGPTRNQY
jgi:hypothetical protein